MAQACIFTIRSPKPSEKRQSFAILKLSKVDGRRVQTTCASDELDRVNRDFQTGVLPFESAYALVDSLRKRLQEKSARRKPLTNQENQKLLDAYWRKEYAHRDLEDPEAMRADLNRALKVLGNLPLYTAEESDIYQKIQKSGLDRNGRRRVMLRLNQLIRFLNRPFRLRLPKQDLPNVKYLNLEDTLALADRVGGIDGHLIRLAFATGMRMGELFALKPENVDAKFHIQVVAQIKRDRKRKLPKTRRTRQISLMPYDFAKESLQVWLAVPVHQRPRLRHYHDIIGRACRQLWPKDQDKWIRFHDLRHSFAIEMLRLDESLDVIAGLLGDSIQVCQTYYTGFSLKSESLDALDARMAERFKSKA